MEIKKEYRAIRSAAQRFVESSDGKIIMDYLRSEYGESEIPTNSVTDMAAAVGARNVYVDLLNLSRRNEE